MVNLAADVRLVAEQLLRHSVIKDPVRESLENCFFLKFKRLNYENVGDLPELPCAARMGVKTPQSRKT